MYSPLTMFFVGRKSLGIFKHTPGVSQIKTIFITPTKTARSLEAAFAMLMQLLTGVNLLKPSGLENYGFCFVLPRQWPMVAFAPRWSKHSFAS